MLVIFLKGNTIRTSIALLCAVIYALHVSLYGHIYLTSLFLCLVGIVYARADFLSILKKLAFLNIFILFVVLSALLENEVDLARVVFLRSNLLMITLLTLFNKKDMFDISIALQELKLPPKVVSLFYFSTKAIYVFQRDIKKFFKTLRARGFHKNSSLFTYKTYSNFFGALIVKAFYNASQMDKMAQIRGFENRLYMLENHAKMGVQEWIVIFALVISFLQIGVIV